MKILFLLLVAVTFLSCTSENKDNEVIIFNNISFKLSEGERLVEIESGLKEDYHSYLEGKNFQIPLFKSITGRGYALYLGIPYNTSIKRLAKFQILDQENNQSVLNTDSVSFMFKKQNNDTVFFVEYLKKFDKNMIYILAKTNSKSISDSLFTQSELSNRFNQK
jgi:hypothetical protein